MSSLKKEISKGIIEFVVLNLLPSQIKTLREPFDLFFKGNQKEQGGHMGQSFSKSNYNKKHDCT